MSESQPDRLTYSMTSRINIGDFEHRDVFFSYQTEVREGESPQKALLRAKKLVKNEIKKVETGIRKRSSEFTDHDTESKISI